MSILQYLNTQGPATSATYVNGQHTGQTNSGASIFQWQQELKSALRTRTQIAEFFAHPFASVPYSIFLPLKLAEKIKKQGLAGPLARQFLPALPEAEYKQEGGMYDPIGDQAHAKGGQLIHRYPTRALFTPTTACPVQCRYCFRKNELNSRDDIFSADFAYTLSYLREHSEIEEIIFTGGDPLMLHEDRLSVYLGEFAKIGHLKFIRFHTRMPVILPSRINPEFGQLLAKFTPRFLINLAIHVNHISEWDAELSWRLKNNLSREVGLLSQTVLLKGVNDHEDHLEELFHLLATTGIRPYYLHHPDQVKGGMHFYLSLEEGSDIFRALKQRLPGWMLPQYVIDTPWGGGKVSAWGPSRSFAGAPLTDLHGDDRPYPYILH